MLVDCFLGVDPRQRQLILASHLDDITGAARTARWLAVPDGNQQVSVGNQVTTKLEEGFLCTWNSRHFNRFLGQGEQTVKIFLTRLGAEGF